MSPPLTRPSQSGEGQSQEPQRHYQHGFSSSSNASQSRGGRKVEFSPTLGAIDSQAPVSNPVAWDTETDHILSYFLGGEHVQHHGAGQAHFASTPGAGSNTAVTPIGSINSAGANVVSGGRASGSVLHSQPSTTASYTSTTSSPRVGSTSASAPTIMEADDEDGDDDDDAPPPTPVVQHFFSSASPSRASRGHHHAPAALLPGHQQQEPQQPRSARSAGSGSTSSSSSLSSMAAALVAGGGPMILQQMQQQQQRQRQRSSAMNTSPSIKHTSPISPSAMLIAAGGQEQLMLPPYSRTPPQLNAGQPSQQPQPIAPQPQPIAPQPIAPQPIAPQPIAPQPQPIAPQPTQPPQPQQPPQPHPATDKQLREQHLAWLSHLNAMAKAAASGGAAASPSVAPGGVVPQPQPGVTMPHPGQVMPVLHPGQMPMSAGVPTHPGVPAHPHHPGMYPFPMAIPQAGVGATHAAARATAPSPSNAAESEEKRIKRLERNRESARKSRRRKKDRLVTGEAKANQLHNKLDRERKKHIKNMVTLLMQKSRRQELVSLLAPASTNEERQRLDERVAMLPTIIHNSGPNSSISQSISEFQYNTLKQMLLPRYQKMLLWFTLKDDFFFTAGKEQFAKQQEQQRKSGGKGSNADSKGSGGESASGSTGARVSWAKISSKQVGDDLTNGAKADKESGPPMPNREEQSRDTMTQQTSYAHDGTRMWPLFCYELRFSVDQEEKFVGVQKRLRDHRSDLAESRSQTSAAVRTATSFQKAVESLSRRVAQREERTLLRILTPQQVATYQQWLATGQNRKRIKASVQAGFQQQQQPQQQHQLSAAGGVQPQAIADIPWQSKESTNAAVTSLDGKESSLLDICRKLNEVLKISDNDRSV